LSITQEKEKEEMNPYGVIGDAHLNFKAYDTDLRTEEVSQAFAIAVDLLSDLPVIVIPGDLFDETTCANWVKRDLLALKEKHIDQIWVIDGGNHDSTKTYSSVSVLDAFAEVHNVIVVNHFIPEELHVNGLHILAIPHTRSQEAFLEYLDILIASGRTWDIALLHCMVGSGLDLSPNDLNIDFSRLEQLASRCGHVWIGHQHGVAKPLDNVYIPGGVVEFNFGELGKKYVYEVEDGCVALHQIPQPREMCQVELDWEGPIQLLDRFREISDSVIYKIIVNGIPAEEYSGAKSAMDVIVAQFKGDIIYNLNKTGHLEVKVTEINASFDLLEEFEIFVDVNQVPAAEDMRSRLTDAVSELLSEEED
jgi:DNA repair exonuclease SbcCD nuclease subunit